MTREIPLTRGFVAVIDDEDYERIAAHRWYAEINHVGAAYAARRKRIDGKLTWIWMHKEILGLPPGVRGDHRNRDTLDNRRSNLRPCTSAQSSFNRSSGRTSSGGFRGVFRDGNGFTARIGFGHKLHYLGRFTDPRSAALVYDAAALRLHGEFAVLNFQPEGSGA